MCSSLCTPAVKCHLGYSSDFLCIWHKVLLLNMMWILQFSWEGAVLYVCWGSHFMTAKWRYCWSHSKMANDSHGNRMENRKQCSVSCRTNSVPAQFVPLEQYAYSLSVSYFSTDLSHWLCFIHRVSWGMRGTMPSFQPLRSLVAGSVSAHFLWQICDKVEFF